MQYSSSSNDSCSATPGVGCWFWLQLWVAADNLLTCAQHWVLVRMCVLVCVCLLEGGGGGTWLREDVGGLQLDRMLQESSMPWYGDRTWLFSQGIFVLMCLLCMLSGGRQRGFPSCAPNMTPMCTTCRSRAAFAACWSMARLWSNATTTLFSTALGSLLWHGSMLECGHISAVCKIGYGGAPCCVAEHLRAVSSPPLYSRVFDMQ